MRTIGWLRHMLLFALVIVSATACSSGGKSYRQGDELSETGKWEEAIAAYEKALAKDPKNERYLTALRKAQQQVASKYYQQTVKFWRYAPAKNYPAVSKAIASLEKAKELDPGNEDVLKLHQELVARKGELIDQTKRSYELGVQALDNNQWLEAVTNFRKVQEIYPDYEDAKDKLAIAVASGSDALYKGGVAAMHDEDWKAALKAFGEVLVVKPGYKNTQVLIDQINEKNNPQYFLERAAELATAKEWDRSITFYERAQSYLPDDDNIKSQLAKAKKQAASHYLDLANEDSKRAHYYRANEEYKKASSLSPSLAESSGFKRALKSHAENLFERASQHAAQRKYGNALAWYWQLRQLYPQYPGLQFKIQETEDAIKKRLKMSVAVFDFTSPSHNPDAGETTSSNLITYLFNNSSGDIKVLGRQQLQSILKEMNLEQAGLVEDMQAARRVARLTDINVFIMGNVLLYKTETDKSKANKVAKIQVGTQIKDNPEYLIWKAKHPKPNEKQLAEAPPVVMEVPEYHYENYTVGRTKMRAVFHVYYKIIDAKKGEIIATDTLKRSREAADEWNDGIPEANIPYDPLELPTESELLEQVTGELVRDLALVILKPFQNLEDTYYKEAKTLLQRGYREQAMEKCFDAVYDTEVKGIESPVSEKAMQIIDQLVSEL